MINTKYIVSSGHDCANECDRMFSKSWGCRRRRRNERRGRTISSVPKLSPRIIILTTCEKDCFINLHVCFYLIVFEVVSILLYLLNGQNSPQRFVCSFSIVPLIQRECTSYPVRVNINFDSGKNVKNDPMNVVNDWREIVVAGLVVLSWCWSIQHHGNTSSIILVLNTRVEDPISFIWVLLPIGREHVDEYYTIRYVNPKHSKFLNATSETADQHTNRYKNDDSISIYQTGSVLFIKSK